NFEDAASWSVPHWRPRAPQYAEPGKPAKGKGSAMESADVPDSTYADGQIAQEAVARLRAAKARPDQSFFLAVGFMKPHLPFAAPKKYWDLYDRDAFTLPAVRTAPIGAPAYSKIDWGELRAYNDIPPSGQLSGSKQISLIHGCHAATSYVDVQIGRVMDELDRLDLTQNTIIVLWGDHGWHLGDHGMWCKHTNYEEATRIPLILCAPGLTRPGTHTKSLVESVDIYPPLPSSPDCHFKTFHNALMAGALPRLFAIPALPPRRPSSTPTRAPAPATAKS
ncbi:MAG: sulfatase-like hydrolase/transferase, partial [Gloeobacteraceae cyanobacterium ES-bin-144]|nr:sulfatase-like hydrolase/transferase [Verrucomicrobiales bacterium]